MGGVAPKQEHSLAAPLIFFAVFFLQLLFRYFELLKKKESSFQIRLHEEINGLLKEANSLSQPATFAQAAKLRRAAAAKEKELEKDKLLEEEKMSKDVNLKALAIVKACMYAVLVFCFWRVPVAIIPNRLAQPFGNWLSWGDRANLDDEVATVGVIPWLLLSSRVCSYITIKFTL